MASLPKITLEDYLRQYLDNVARKNEKISFSDYSEKYHSDYRGRYADAITRILEDERRAASGESVVQEKLAGKGLSGGGYARYVASGLTTDNREARQAAEDEYKDSLTKAENQYSRYEIAYDIKQQELAEELAKKFKEDKIVSPQNAYAYAIEAGLSKESATALSISVTAATRDELKHRLVEGLFNRTLSAESAVALAKLYGIEGEELEKLESMFEWYKVNHTEIPKDFLDYITNLAGYFNPLAKYPDN